MTFLTLHSQLVTALSTAAKLADLKAFSVFVHERVLESRCGQDSSGPPSYLAEESREIEGFPGDSAVRTPPANEGDSGLIPGSGRFPGEGNGYPLHILAWTILWTEEPSGLQSMGSQRVGCD